MTFPFAGGDVRQRGVALITALLVVAIAGILAVELVWHTNLDLRRTDQLLNWEQAQQYGYGAEDFAISMLQQFFDKGGATYPPKDEPTDYCGQPGDLPSDWPMQLPFDRGGIQARVCDMQGRFDLNNLAPNGVKDPLAVTQFKRLLMAVDEMDDNIEIAPDEGDTIAESAVDWIDADSTAEGFHGAEDDYYMGQTPPYRTANWLFTDVSELLALKTTNPEMRPGIYEALKNYVTALPVHTPINVNTASEQVFRSLGENLEANAEQWASHTESDWPFTDLARFHGAAGIDQAMVTSNYLGFTTNYLQLDAIITVGTTHLEMYSLLERSDVNGQGSVRVILRSFRSIDADIKAVTAKSPKEGEVVKSDE